MTFLFSSSSSLLHNLALDQVQDATEINSPSAAEFSTTVTASQRFIQLPEWYSRAFFCTVDKVLNTTSAYALKIKPNFIV